MFFFVFDKTFFVDCKKNVKYKPFIVTQPLQMPSLMFFDKTAFTSSRTCGCNGELKHHC